MKDIHDFNELINATLSPELAEKFFKSMAEHGHAGLVGQRADGSFIYICVCDCAWVSRDGSEEENKAKYLAHERDKHPRRVRH